MADEEEQLLSPELAAQLGAAGGAAMLTGAKKKQSSKPGGGGGGKHGPRRASAAPVEKKLSKSQRRKLAKIEEDKRKREARAGVVARLNAAKLVSDESLSLLQGSDRMGQRMSKRETLRRELKAERAGIALPGSENSRLTKRERPDDVAGGGGGDASDDDDDASGDDDDDFGRKTSWPKLGPSGAAPPPKESYGPIHPLDQARLDAERIAAAEAAALAGGDDDDDDAEASANDADAREKFKLALAAARELAAQIRQRDPEQAAEAAVEALGPAAAAAAIDPKDAAAQLAAANEAAAAAAAAKFPGVFVGASRAVSVTRLDDIQEVREGLPILGAEHDIVDAINTNPIVVICGETGCGKTTQVPQFLYEAGYGDPECAAHPGAVAVTQPRRVAVTSTAARVAAELNVPLGGDVGYQVRYDKRVGDEPRVKFMTDGILLREIQSDVLLRKYSVIIVDEAHERSVNTDILLGLLSRVVPLRAELAMEGRAGITPLRLVVMSATLRVEEFVGNKKLCPTPPALLKVAARQFPVTVHFSRETVHGDYLGAAKKKVLAIHRKLPPGGVLVFLTGQREVDQLCAKLRAAHPAPAARDDGGETGGGRGATGGGPRAIADGSRTDRETSGEDADDLPGLDAYDADAADGDGSDERNRRGENSDEDSDDFAGRDDFDDASDHDDSASDVSEEDEVVVHAGEGVDPEEAAAAEADWVRAHAPTTAAAAAAGDASGGDVARDDGPGHLHVLPLYAMLPPDLQRRVFDPPPPGSRLVVVATNVAETSLTIPGVRYVVDCGREKRRVNGDDATGGGGGGAASAGLSRFSVEWVSKASAEQRAGRAGRTGPGHCYRLFSSAHFVDSLDAHAPPAILGVPIDGVALQMRAMGIDRVARFPFISPPEPAALARAQRTLMILGALRPVRGGDERGTMGASGDDDDVGALTPVGRAMAALPISPRHARMLLAAAASDARGCLAGAVAAAAALSLDSPFLRGDGADADADAEDGRRDVDSEEASRVPSRRRARVFHHEDSDALSAARALVAYDAIGDPRDAHAFCVEHRLHGKTMREMSDLRRQLLRVLASPPPTVAVGAAAAADVVSPAARRAVAAAAAAIARAKEASRRAFRRRGPHDVPRDDENPSRSVAPLDPASAALEARSPGDVALRRALLVGWADRVARRAKAAEAAASAERDEAEGNGRTRATRYRPAMLDATVFLHPTSALHRTSPEYVVYVDVIQTAKRPYLARATAVDGAWLVDDAPAMTSLSAALEDPAPRYAPGRDAVVTFHQPHFGRHRWALPLHAKPAAAAEPGACGAFAAALLSGAVSPPVGDLRERLAAKPSICARPEGKSQRRVGELVHALRRRGVATRAALVAAWRSDATFLLPELRDWMRSGQGHALERAWPKIVAGAAEAHAKGATKTAVDSDETTKKAARAAKRDAERSAGGAGLSTPEKKKPRKTTKKNVKALGGELSIWD